LKVEDDPKDVELTLTALEEYNLANEVVVTRDGEEGRTSSIPGGNSRHALATTPLSFCWI
jgi:hypothetical protein